MPGIVSEVSATLVARITRRCGMLAKTLRLIGGRQARVERLHHRVAEVAREQRVLGLADLALAREEHEDVAARVERGHVRDRVGDRVGSVDVVGGRLVEHVDRDTCGPRPG